MDTKKPSTADILAKIRSGKETAEMLAQIRAESESKGAKTDSDKSFQVFYQLEVHGIVTDWHLLVMDEPYGDTIKGPDLLTTLHWRMRDISLAIQKLESDVCKLVEFKVVEKNNE